MPGLQTEMIVAVTGLQWAMVAAVIGLIVFLIIQRRRQE